jgi:NADH-quinone oxidoreductase subunit B
LKLQEKIAARSTAQRYAGDATGRRPSAAALSSGLVQPPPGGPEESSR